MDDQNYSCALEDKWFWESEVRWSLWIYWKDDFWTMKWGLGGKKIMYIDSKGEMDVVTLGRAKCGVTGPRWAFKDTMLPKSFCSFQFISNDFQRSVIIIGLEKISSRTGIVINNSIFYFLYEPPYINISELKTPHSNL